MTNPLSAVDISETMAAPLGDLIAGVGRGLAEAQQSGFRTYLYYIATSDPAINVSRVAHRVALGGHPVPREKIVERYHRSLALLRDAIGYTNRAYIFDNSVNSTEQKHTWLAEITDGTKVELKTEKTPAWFVRAVLDKAT